MTVTDNLFVDYNLRWKYKSRWFVRWYI